MEYYIKSLEQLLTPGHTVTRTDGQNTNDVIKGVIFINTKCLDDCPDVTELHNMLTKRLSPKKGGKGSTDYRIVAMCCLASRGYSVNHKSVHGISDKGMSKVWSTLERSKISSSSKLRPWISQNLSFRSYEGFSATVGCNRHISTETVVTNTPRVAKIFVSVPVASFKVDLVVGSSLTVKGAMATDAKLLHAVKVCSNEQPPSFRTLFH